jgi:hypothetical protein
LRDAAVLFEAHEHLGLGRVVNQGERAHEEAAGRVGTRVVASAVFAGGDDARAVLPRAVRVDEHQVLLCRNEQRAVVADRHSADHAVELVPLGDSDGAVVEPALQHQTGTDVHPQQKLAGGVPDRSFRQLERLRGGRLRRGHGAGTAMQVRPTSFSWSSKA